MFNHKTLFILLLIGCSGAIDAHAGEQVFKGEIWDNLCAKEGSHAAMMKKAGVNTTAKCTIGCAMTRGKYVLYDPGTKEVYQLDDQKRPLEFAGKAVEVKGILDPASSTIHVASIELAQANKQSAKPSHEK